MSEVWDYAPLGLLCDFKSGGTPESTNLLMWSNSETGIPWISISDMSSTDVITEPSQYISELGQLSAGISCATPGTVLFAMYASVGEVAVLGIDAGWNQAILGLTPLDPKRLEPRFLFHALKWIRPSLPMFYRSNTQDNLNAETVKRLRIPFPPLETQRRIADYLDRETAEIDEMVRVLDEYRKLLAMRRKKYIDSRLDSIPISTRLGYIADVLIGLTYSPEDVVDSGGTAVYRSGNIQNGRIDRTDLVRVDRRIPEELRFRSKDLLLCSRNGSATLVGKNALIEEPDIGQTWGAFMSVIRSPFNEFLYWALQGSLLDQLRGSFASSTVNQLTTSTLQRIEVPYPDSRDTDRIVKEIREEVQRIEQLSTDAEALRSLLLKRRQVLINDVVTGKKQV